MAILDAKPLDLHIFRHDDDDEDLFFKNMLQAMVNGDVTPLKAATDMDTWIVDKANSRLKEVMKRPSPTKLTPDERKQGILSKWAIVPNPSGDIEEVFRWIARLCSAFAPYHPGQDRIIQFLEALRATPEHEVPHGPSASQGETITLWPFGGYWLGLPEQFRKEAADYSYPYYGVSSFFPENELPLRSRNYQSAIARIAALGFVECGFLCALDHILPSSYFYTNFMEGKVDAANIFGIHVIAGAQWVIRPGECRFVYQECKKNEKVPNRPREMWSMERWRQWRDQFAIVAEDEKFDSETRLVAKNALQHMIAVEEDANCSATQ